MTGAPQPVLPVPHRLDQLAPYTDRKKLRVVVESPRGSRVKYEYSPETGGFLLKRPLPAGLSYPFDWGFIPGTQAADGDPVDMMLLGDHVSYPGVLVEARALAILHVTERAQDEGKAEDNPRILAIPAWLERAVGEAIFAPLRNDLREFLVRVGEDAGKEILDAQWGSGRDADAYIDAHRKAR